MRLRFLIPVALAMVLGFTACSSEQTTSETTTTTQPVASQPQQSETVTTKTTKTTDSGHSSLLGATANFVWTVVAFPFRVAGDILGEIV